MQNKMNTRGYPRTINALLAVAAISCYATSVSAETFDIKGSVQKAVALNEVGALNFGTVFTTTPDTTAAAAANSSKLTMSPNGVVTQAKGSALTSPPLIQMLAGAPGSYASAAMPSGSTVWIKLAHPDAPMTTVPPVSATPDTCAYPTPSAAIAAGRIVLAQGEYSGFFCVDSFTSDRAGLLDDATKYSIGGGTGLTFKIGATLITQADSAAPPYLEGSYTGQYIMEINF